MTLKSKQKKSKNLSRRNFVFMTNENSFIFFSLLFFINFSKFDSNNSISNDSSFASFAKNPIRIDFKETVETFDKNKERIEIIESSSSK